MKIQRRKLVRPASTSGRGPAHSTTEERLLTFDIPAGTKVGTKIRFTEEGNQLPGQIPADVVFIVQDHPHPLFLREGAHLHTQVTIGLRLALLGGEVKVVGLRKEKHIIKLKPLTNSGQTVRVPNAGLPTLPVRPGTAATTPRGDLIVHFVIEMPPASTVRQMRVIKDFPAEKPPKQMAPQQIERSRPTTPSRSTFRTTVTQSTR
ncbi:hypothetical protein AAHC03_026042 [Spirometra sp. Aus1]